MGYEVGGSGNLHFNQRLAQEQLRSEQELWQQRCDRVISAQYARLATEKLKYITLLKGISEGWDVTTHVLADMHFDCVYSLAEYFHVKKRRRKFAATTHSHTNVHTKEHTQSHTHSHDSGSGLRESQLISRSVVLNVLKIIFESFALYSQNKSIYIYAVRIVC